MSITVVINTLNEEINIAECIKSVLGIADEILVCDMYSEDRTVDIANSFNARIIHVEKSNFVEPARYYSISQASCDWILVLDADERMTENLAKKLIEISTKDDVDVVMFWSLFWYFGGWVKHGIFFSGQWPRFFRKETYLSTYSSDEELVHQNFSGLRNHPKRLNLSAEFYILHLAYPTIEKYVTKTIGYYARIEGEQYFNRSVKFSVFSLVIDPIKFFIKSFILRKGYLDGVRGLILSALYAMYRFCIWANLWFLENSSSEGQMIESFGK